MLPRLRFLGNALWRLVFLGLIASVAFGWSKSGFRRGVVFVLLSMALGGMALGLGEGGFDKLLLSAAVLWALCRMGFGGDFGQEYIPVTIRNGEQTIQITALKDTGNTLRDPITGEQVLVIGADVAAQLTGLSCDAFTAPMETMVKYPGYRLISYRAVGQPGGMLLAKRYPDVTMGHYSGSAVIAFAPEKIGNSGNYQALTGGAV